MMHATADGADRGVLRPPWPQPDPGCRVVALHPRREPDLELVWADDLPGDDVTPEPVDADAAVVELYEREYAEIARLAYLLVGDRHRAEDLAHDAFVRLYEHWDDLKEPSKAVGWLRATTSNLAMTSHRRARTARKYRELERAGWAADLGTARSAEAEALASSARPDVVQALQQLSPKQRAAVVLKHWLRMTETEIAEALGCSVGSARTHISRGHSALARKLGGHR